ncbi:MAG: ribose 1,5-bisphosphate isomerase [Desulfurococcaceae archaeon]
MGLEIPRPVLDIAEKIKSMEIRGAGRIARSAAEAMKIAAVEYRGVADLKSFNQYIYRVAEILLSTRPTAVSLPNAVFYILTGLENTISVNDAREHVIRKADEFIKMTLDAYDKISDFGAKRIKYNSTVLTHCHSTAALNIIIRAFKEGRIVKVYSTETRPLFQGRITARTLLEHGIPTIQIPDSAVRYVMHDVDHVVVGADAVACNGAVVNKIGTSQIALAAKEARVRLYVASETYKFSPETAIGELIPIEERSPEEIVPRIWLSERKKIKVMNPVFDITPPEYIDLIITEIGIIPPQLASYVLFEIYGWNLDKIKTRLMIKTIVEEED